MQTGNFIKVDDVLFNAAGFAGDLNFKSVPRGFYINQISDAFEELNMDTMLMTGQVDFTLADYSEHLTMILPKDCFNVRNIWIYDGDVCNIGLSRKVWHKSNFYSQGQGYLANRTGRNTNDPFFINDTLVSRAEPKDKSLIRYVNQDNVNETLFYNIQNGNLMLSASCRNAGTKVHIHYNSTGCEVGEAPIIPRFYKKAIEDYTTEAALRFRMATDPGQANNWKYLHQDCKQRLDKDGMSGSWHKAVEYSMTMSNDEKESLSVYLGRGAWLNGQ